MGGGIKISFFCHNQNAKGNMHTCFSNPASIV